MNDKEKYTRKDLYDIYLEDKTTKSYTGWLEDFVVEVLQLEQNNACKDYTYLVGEFKITDKVKIKKNNEIGVVVKIDINNDHPIIVFVKLNKRFFTTYEELEYISEGENLYNDFINFANEIFKKQNEAQDMLNHNLPYYLRYNIGGRYK